MGDSFRESAPAGEIEPKAARFVVTCDAEGSLVELSTECRRFTGASPAHYSGFRWLELIHKNERARIVELIGTSIATSTPQRCRIRRSDGEYCWFEVLAEPRSWSVIEQGQAGAKKVSERVVLTATEVDSI